MVFAMVAIFYVPSFVACEDGERVRSDRIQCVWDVLGFCSLHVIESDLCMRDHLSASGVPPPPW